MKIEYGLKVQDPRAKEQETRERVEEAVKRKKDATETLDEALERITGLKFSDKERDLFQIGRAALLSGETSRLRSGSKLSKAEVLEIAATITSQRQEILREERIREVLETKPDNYFILTDDEELPGFIDRIKQEIKLQRSQWPGRFEMLGVESLCAGDFEGTGIDVLGGIDLSIGFSIWLPLLAEGYYLPYGHVDGFDVPHAFKKGDKQLTRSKVLAAIVPYLSAPKQGKTFHMGSARYDLHIAKNDGYEIRGCVWDTLDAMYLMNEHEPDGYGLKPLVQRYGKRFGITGTVFTFEDLFGNGSPAPYNTELTGIYAINDVKYGFYLFDWQFETMKKTDRLLDCYALIDSKLPETDLMLNRTGFEVDLDELKKLEVEFTEKMEQAKKEVFESYQIDAGFLHKMSLTINGEKIEKWIAAQQGRIKKNEEAIRKQQAIIAECEDNKKTHLKKYQDAKERLAACLEKRLELVDPAPENAPDYIPSFEFTNGNHIAFLVYDYLKIKDRTSKVKRGKERSTASDVMEMYYTDEESLKPLAVVAEYEKLLNTYVCKIPGALENDGRLHTVFKAGGTSTGRYSSSGYGGRPIDILNDFK